MKLLNDHSNEDFWLLFFTIWGLRSISNKFNSVFAWSLMLAVDMVCGWVILELYP